MWIVQKKNYIIIITFYVHRGSQSEDMNFIHYANVSFPFDGDFIYISLLIYKDMYIKSQHLIL